MTEQWRYRCPEGHTFGSIERKQSRRWPYHCTSCDKYYARLKDHKTGETVKRPHGRQMRG